MTNVDEDVGEKKPSQTVGVGGNVQWCSHCGKQNGGFSKKLNKGLLYDPEFPLLGRYLGAGEEMLI